MRGNISTIQLKKKNLKMLEILKKRMGAKSYDEVIEKLIEEKLDLPSKMFGIDKGKISSFKEEDRMEDRV
ncbi:MAG: VapB-type antitoxin [Nitrososphaerota archaeon]